jgi:hypothetical protein
VVDPLLCWLRGITILRAGSRWPRKPLQPKDQPGFFTSCSIFCWSFGTPGGVNGRYANGSRIVACVTMVSIGDFVDMKHGAGQVSDREQNCHVLTKD